MLRLRWRGYAIFFGLVAGFIAAVYIQEGNYLYAAMSAFLVIVAALVEFTIADILTEKLYPSRTQDVLDRLESNLRGYHDHIKESIGRAIQGLSGCDKSRISGTFHLVVELYRSVEEGFEEALVQVTDYSGALGGRRWRFNSLTRGLIGRCLRTGESEWVNFSSDEDYIHRMINEFGYTKIEMMQRTQEARSYWAEPVYAHKKLIGVVFFFSTEIQVFPHAVDLKDMRAHAREISAYLEGAGLVS